MRDDTSLHAYVEESLAQRSALTIPFFQREAPRIAALCHQMALRFARGGRLIALGHSPAAQSDVRHISVEFVHPVIVGKRALPAFGLSGDVDDVARQLDLLARPADTVFALDRHDVAMRSARDRDCLTIALSTVGAAWEFCSPSPDPFSWQETGEILYHLLWELVHVFFEHGVGAADVPHDTSRNAAASFLYPFLDKPAVDVTRILDDVGRSILLKAAEVGALREQTLGERDSPNRNAIFGAARALRRALDAGGTVLAMGNGGSATDAMDAAADYTFPPSSLPARRALDLSTDSATITALTNDIGPDVIFSRQIIAYGQSSDVVMAFSTSGDSRNIIHALAEARARKLTSIAFVGYNGGQILNERLADHVIVANSQNIPRIQEAHAVAHHIIRHLVERIPA